MCVSYYPLIRRPHDYVSLIAIDSNCEDRSLMNQRALLDGCLG